jgi:hypothetical protein
MCADTCHFALACGTVDGNIFTQAGMLAYFYPAGFAFVFGILRVIPQYDAMVTMNMICQTDILFEYDARLKYDARI